MAQIFTIKPLEWRVHQDGGLHWARPTGFILLRIEENESPRGRFYEWTIRVGGTSSGIFGESGSLKESKRDAEKAYLEMIEKALTLHSAIEEKPTAPTYEWAGETYEKGETVEVSNNGSHYVKRTLERVSYGGRSKAMLSPNGKSEYMRKVGSTKTGEEATDSFSL